MKMRVKGAVGKKTTLKIIRVFLESPTPLHLNEVMRRSGLGKGTVSRVLTVLVEKGFLKKEKAKNRIYFQINKNLSIEEIGKITQLPFFDDFYAFLKKSNISGIFKEDLKNLEDFYEASEKISKSFQDFYEASEKISEKAEEFKKYVESNRSKIEFLRKELLIENIDIYNLSIQGFFKVIEYFKHNEKSYNTLRKKGQTPLEAIKWAEFYRSILVMLKMKRIPATHWAFSKRKQMLFLEHPYEILRREYGLRDTIDKSTPRLRDILRKPF